MRACTRPPSSNRASWFRRRNSTVTSFAGPALTRLVTLTWTGLLGLTIKAAIATVNPTKQIATWRGNITSSSATSLPNYMVNPPTDELNRFQYPLIQAPAFRLPKKLCKRKKLVDLEAELRLTKGRKGTFE